MKRLFTGIAVAASLATIATAENRIDGQRPDAPALAAPGDFKVGVTTLTFTNTDQIDIVNATADTAPIYDRELTVEV